MSGSALPQALTDTPANNPPPNDAGRATSPALPNVDDVLGGKPSADDLLGKPPAPPVMSGAGWDYYFKDQPVARVLNAFGQGAQQGFGTSSLGFDQTTEDALKKAGIFNDVSKGQQSIIRSVNEAVMRPAAAIADTVWRAGGALFSGLQAGAAQTAREAVASAVSGGTEAPGEEEGPLARDIAAMPEAFMGMPHGMSEYKVGAGEGAYMGTSEAATPPADVPGELARHEAEAAKEAPQATGAPQPTYAPGALGPQPTEAPMQPYAPTRDINAVARTIAPDTFKEYDGLAARRDELRSQLSAETQKLQENAAAQAPHAAEIADLEQRLDAGTTPRLAKKYEERLATMRPDHDAFLQSDQFAMLTRDTDEMVDMRAELQKADYRMRDLAPDVGAAYKQAQQQFPEAEQAAPTAGLSQAPGSLATQPEPPAQLAPVAGAEPVAQPPASTPELLETAQNISSNIEQPTPLQARYAEVSANEADLSRQAEAQRSPTFIADDVAQKLQAAGRPLEESQAAAALVQAHYEARADRFDGAKGTAQELYAAEAPDIRGGEVGGRGGAAAGKAYLKDGRTVITLFQKADASTFLHETGHAWLEEMLSDAKDERAPDDLRRDAATVRDWLGAGADDAIKTAQHEKFARGFERYLMEGTAPSRALDRVFAQFRDWLTKIYQTVQKLKAPITDDIRDVFDRMLAKSPEPAVLAPEAASEVAPARPDVAPKIRTIQEIMEGERVSAARARRIQEQEIAARAHYTSSAPEPSPEAKITGDLASLHESDAETTEPLHAAGMADQIQAEREEAARTHAPELSGGPTGGTEAEAGRGPGPGEQVRRPGGGDSTAGGSGGNTPELETVSARGGEAAAESRRPPEFAADAYPGAEPRYVDKAGNIRLELLTDDVAARAALKEEAELSGDFMNARRGVISDPQILDIADMINATSSQLNLDKLRQMSVEDGVPMAARIKAGRKMLLQAEQAVREAAAGTDVMAFVNAGDRLNMIQETVSGITAEWGRAGRAFRDMKADTEGTQDVAAILREATGRELCPAARSDAAHSQSRHAGTGG